MLRASEEIVIISKWGFKMIAKRWWMTNARDEDEKEPNDNEVRLGGWRSRL